MMKYTIWIVDDEETIRDGLGLVLSEKYDIFTFPDAESFLEKLNSDISAEHMPDVILLDIGLPEINGIEALQMIKKKHAHIPTIMITAYEETQMVIDSMKIGAFDFIIKPLNPDLLELTIRKALKTITLRKEVQILQENYLKDHLPAFIGKSKNIEDIMTFIELVAQSPDTPIMISGETGTGKELIARAIHARSPIFQGPFVAINCSAFPDDLIESELFGYEPGAFSGASAKGKKGIIEEAAGGTLFLDEVADLSLSGQAKLLRFLETKDFFKVGGTKKQTVSIRIVSATNKDIDDLVKTGRFRKDLYFRLCVVKADIPALNDRNDDILPLAKHFLVEYNKKFNKNISGISKEAAHLLINHCFSGNVRELKNIIERATLIASGQMIEASDLGLGMSTDKPQPADDSPPDIPETGLDLNQLLETIEKKYLDHALVLSHGNESKAARLLKMNHHTFRYKLKKHTPPSSPG
jgi:two-component system response regulator AtoC